jgi:hypothetical protein
MAELATHNATTFSIGRGSTQDFFGAEHLFVERYCGIEALNNDVECNSEKPCEYRMDPHEGSLPARMEEQLTLLQAHAPGRLGQDFLWDFPQSDAEFEHGRFRPAAPPSHFPMGTDELDLWPCRQIEQQRNFLTIELLWKSRKRFGIPRRAIRRTEDADIERFLLDDVGDGERQQKNPALRPAHIDRRPVSFGVDNGFFGNDKGFHHHAKILAERETSASCDVRLANCRGVYRVTFVIFAAGS